MNRALLGLFLSFSIIVAAYGGDTVLNSAGLNVVFVGTSTTARFAGVYHDGTVCPEYFQVQMQSLSEIDSRTGNIVSSVSLANVNWTLGSEREYYMNGGTNYVQVYNITATLPNGAINSWELLLIEQPTTIVWDNITIETPPFTAKLSMSLSGWPFQNMSNSFAIEAIFDIPTPPFTFSRNSTPTLLTIQLNALNSSLVAVVPLSVQLEQAAAPIKMSLMPVLGPGFSVTGLAVKFMMSSFVDLKFDPNFNVILSNDHTVARQQQQPVLLSQRNTIIISVLVPVGVICMGILAWQLYVWRQKKNDVGEAMMDSPVMD